MVRVLLPLLLVLVACGGQASSAGPATPARIPAPAPAPAPTPTRTPAPSPISSPSDDPTGSPAPTPAPTSAPQVTDRPDPRWHFYAADHHAHTSPWFAGVHHVMIGFGCTVAPYYDHDPRCPGREGFHHGIDVAMPCGTQLTSAVVGVVLPTEAPGAPGPAYGVHPFRIHTGDVDVLIGHTRTVFVRPGQQVHPGQRIALSSDSGAPDGCHLHFEVRRHGQGLAGAVDPAPLLELG